jgi:carbonic anhydrase/acetyltransferase-like protein (isoleucine patch superfamily)
MSGRILRYRDRTPRIAPTAFIAPDATLIGDVEVGEDSGVWFGCVIRGDVNPIKVGARTNIQDGTIVHVTRKLSTTTIGSDVTIGHRAIVHGCTLEHGCFIGMAATLMDGVVVEAGAMVAAGALVTPGKRVAKGQLWGGSPAAYMRDLTPEEAAYIKNAALHYAELARNYRESLGVHAAT